MEKEPLNITYVKRKNTELFKQFQKEQTAGFTDLQNYIPIYNKFLALNTTNYNSVNLNHTMFISSIKQPIHEDKHVYQGIVQQYDTGKQKKAQIFLKLAPLLDPFKYLIGKYNANDTALFTLPKISSSGDVGTVHPKLLDYNNCAYVDGFFSFLSSRLIHENNFVHGVDYYGSFLCMKKQFKLNIVDDLEYLCKSEYFLKHKNELFTVEDYSYLYQPEPEKKLNPINISNQSPSALSVHSIESDLFDGVFENDNHLTLDDVKEQSLDVIQITSSDITNTTTIKTSSTCSSRTSHTASDSFHGEDIDQDTNKSADCKENDYKDNDRKESDTDDDDISDCFSSEEYEEETIHAVIPMLPVQMICMEHCETTFDDLILNEELSQDEWMSALMQIIMILITYQKAFAFTHNDLHTNNVMFNKTNAKYIYYCYKKTYYKVPTFGRIFKVIDFGRAIYKCNGHLYCSDSFQTGADAATQYNTEPYFNEKKPRLDPNFSFDLCRLACSIFDYVIEDLDEIGDLETCEPIVRLIFEWCLDDNGINILYKNNGDERYPDFKLYKMIARCVHHHIPQAQLSRPEFKQYVVSKQSCSQESTIHIDEIPSFV